MQSTLKPYTVFCHDNLPIMRGINSSSIDLIYLDPPFNKGKSFHAPVGVKAEGASFDDIWHEESIKDEWHEEIKARLPELYKYLDAVGGIGSRSAKYYLIYMTVRIIEMHRILKDTGSLYLHCDPTASHYLKLLLDTIFGHKNFKNEIVWAYRGMPSEANKYQQKHDIILFYTKSPESDFNVQFGEPTDESKQTFKSGILKGYNTNLSKKMVTVFDWEKYHAAVKKGTIPSNLKPKEFQGGNPPLRDWWEDIKILGGPGNKERVGYPTQKPLKLLDRIIIGSSHKGDVVLDPFCGCATTCIAASRQQRQWIGIDVSRKAFELVKLRLEKQVSTDLFKPRVIYREDIPSRTDVAYKRKHTAEDKFFLYGKQDGKCNACKTKFSAIHLEVDHIIPKTDGGGNERENLQLLCSRCNRIKGGRSMSYLMAQLKKEGSSEGSS